MSCKKSQKERILLHLKRFKTITVLNAFRMGICCLHKRIAELKADGHKIGGYMDKVRTRDGFVHVKRHYLVGKA